MPRVLPEVTHLKTEGNASSAPQASSATVFHPVCLALQELLPWKRAQPCVIDVLLVKPLDRAKVHVNLANLVTRRTQITLSVFHAKLVLLLGRVEFVPSVHQAPSADLEPPNVQSVHRNRSLHQDLRAASHAD